MKRLLRGEFTAGPNELFEPSAVDEWIGKPVTMGGSVVGTVVAAWVEDDGRKIVYDVELDKDTVK